MHRWLDIGCGSRGREAVLRMADQASLFGIDPSPAYVAAARRRLDDPRVQVEVGDAIDLPLPDASVDQVVSRTGAELACNVTAALRRGPTCAGVAGGAGDGLRLGLRGQRAGTAPDCSTPPSPRTRRRRGSTRVRASRSAALAGSAVFEAAGCHVVDARPVEVAMDFRDFDDSGRRSSAGRSSPHLRLATLPDHAGCTPAPRDAADRG